MALEVKNTQPRTGEALWKTVDAWAQTYWSGLDAQFYAGNILLDEVLSLQWELVEAVLPVYGYADYTYRTAVHGTRRVQGAFQINFKREGYLYDVLRALANPGLTGATGRTQAGKNVPAGRMARTGTATIEDFLALVTPDPVKPNRTGSGLKLDKSSVDAARLKSVTDAFEEAIWGDPVANAPQAAVGALKFAQPNGPKFQLAQPFDLHIQFGSVDAETLRQRQAERQTQAVREAHPSTPVSTYSRLVALEINSRQTMYDDSGRPITETYGFLAKDAL
jgi:hypothetical protein